MEPGPPEKGGRWGLEGGSWDPGYKSDVLRARMDFKGGQYSQ